MQKLSRKNRGKNGVFFENARLLIFNNIMLRNTGLEFLELHGKLAAKLYGRVSKKSAANCEDKS